MSHQPHPHQPGWAVPQPPRPPKKTRPAALVGIGCLGIVFMATVVSALTSLTGGDSNDKSDKAAAKAPRYEIVEQDTSGNKRNVVVEVDSTKSLKAVFDDVTGKLTEEAGYYVVINCSTGGTDDVDNRLANGQKAVGSMGAATTGLEDGDTEFSTNPDRTCPVDPADEAKEEADRDAAAKAAGLPPEPTGAKRQELLDAIEAVNPDAVRHEDKAVDAARNQCSAINGEANRLDWLAAQRFTYKDVTTTEAQGKQINAALKRIGFCDV
ncbi:hypothetical protein E4N62_46765 [Streptomyces sp. MNU76]|uniref:hypothetical protein n=1 Tax=Streptomyces sp. MNU76 TaxID=2560026 RepID=UPI001E564179|nr:hypothetical protein [Streptomyces sp. MNU76]MCC9712060.1 hypothetical protein [Streptomyces sp. MNU76]